MICIPALPLSLLVSLTPHAQAGLEIMAEHVPPLPARPDTSFFTATAYFGIGTDSGKMYDNKILQTFQAGVSAPVDFVLFRMTNNTAGKPDPRIRIIAFDESSGLIQDQLGEASIDSATIPEFHPSSQISRLNVFADFRNSGITLVEGESYALVLDIAAGDASHGITKTDWTSAPSQSYWRSQNSEVFTKKGGSLLFQIVSGYDAALSTLDYGVNYFHSPPEDHFNQSAFIHRLRWVARPGVTYRAMISNDLTNWFNLPLSNYNASSMTATVPVMTLDWTTGLSNFPDPGDFHGFYRIEEIE